MSNKKKYALVVFVVSLMAALAAWRLTSKFEEGTQF